MNQSNSLKRNMSLITLKLTGHLFDTKCFNECIDICENHSIQFRVVGWEIGNLSQQPSSVQIQLMTKDKLQLNEAMDQIEENAERCKIKIGMVGLEEIISHDGFS